jgi:hypothetical protein
MMKRQHEGTINPSRIYRANPDQRERVRVALKKERKRLMKRLGVYLLVLGGIALSVVLAYKYVVLGQTDLGFKYDYAYCSNGIFTTRPKGADKGEIAYYKSEAKRVLLARCLPDDPKPPINCREMKEAAGECRKFSIWRGVGK